MSHDSAPTSVAGRLEVAEYMLKLIVDSHRFRENYPHMAQRVDQFLFEAPAVRASETPATEKRTMAREGAAVAQGGAAEHRPDKPEVVGNQSDQPSPIRDESSTGAQSELHAAACALLEDLGLSACVHFDEGSNEPCDNERGDCPACRLNLAVKRAWPSAPDKTDDAYEGGDALAHDDSEQRRSERDTGVVTSPPADTATSEGRALRDEPLPGAHDDASEDEVDDETYGYPLERVKKVAAALTLWEKDHGRKADPDSMMDWGAYFMRAAEIPRGEAVPSATDDALRDIRITLTKELGHVYLSCAEPPCPACLMLSAFDEACKVQGR